MESFLNKLAELKNLIIFNAKTDLSRSGDNSNAIDEVTIDSLEKSTQIRQINESVDDITTYLLTHPIPEKEEN